VLRFHRSSRQIESPADAGSTTLAIRDPCSRNILHATAARIEDYELVLGHAPTLSACRKVSKFSMDLVFRHGPRTQRVVEIAAGSTSLNVIHKDARTAHEGRSNLLLLGVVGTDGRNEAPLKSKSSVRIGDFDVVQVIQMSASGRTFRS
jgi:hypothetical protein